MASENNQHLLPINRYLLALLITGLLSISVYHKEKVGCAT